LRAKFQGSPVHLRCQSLAAARVARATRLERPHRTARRRSSHQAQPPISAAGPLPPVELQLAGRLPRIRMTATAGRDPASRMWPLASPERGAPRTATLHRFETDVLARERTTEDSPT